MYLEKAAGQKGGVRVSILKSAHPDPERLKSWSLNSFVHLVTFFCVPSKQLNGFILRTAYILTARDRTHNATVKMSSSPNKQILFSCRVAHSTLSPSSGEEDIIEKAQPPENVQVQAKIFYVSVVQSRIPFAPRGWYSSPPPYCGRGGVVVEECDFLCHESLHAGLGSTH